MLLAGGLADGVDERQLASDPLAFDDDVTGGHTEAPG